MNKVIALSYNDLKNVFRDKTLYSIAFFPLMLGLFARYVYPWLAGNFEFLWEYKAQVLMFSGMQGPFAMGMIAAFVILDEKDEGVIQALRVMPVSSSVFIAYRILFATVGAFLFGLIVLPLSGLFSFSVGEILVQSMMFGLTAPIIALFVATFARNKVEGLALIKGLSLGMYLPMLTFFFPQAALHFTGLIPMYWTFYLVESITNAGFSMIYFLGGIACHFSILGILVWQFRKRVF